MAHKIFNPKSMLPLTEPMYYTLLALNRPQHGYSIMQTVEKISRGRVKIGAGTLYAMLARFLGNGIIERKVITDSSLNNRRRKVYMLSENGKVLLKTEYIRILSMIQDFDDIFKR